MKLISIYLIFVLSLFSCEKRNVKIDVKKQKEKLILKRDNKTYKYAYFDENGKKILGDYFIAYTDTIIDYGIVADPGFVLIDRKGNHIYNIFPYDNSPDYTSEGLYRVIDNGKIGYADSLTSKIVIQPQFDCAFPFENGKAKVSNECNNAYNGDHVSWESNHWYYIDKKGNKLK